MRFATLRLTVLRFGALRLGALRFGAFRLGALRFAPFLRARLRRLGEGVLLRFLVAQSGRIAGWHRVYNTERAGKAGLRLDTLASRHCPQ